MKYFTKEWCFSEIEDDEIENRLRLYNDYINGIYSKIPFTLKLLTRHINFHDGKIRNIAFSEPEQSLKLSGIFGDKQSGYFFLELNYLTTKRFDINNLLGSCDKEIEILSDELEALDDGAFSHKILLSTGESIDILFLNVSIKLKDATPRDYTAPQTDKIIW